MSRAEVTPIPTAPSVCLLADAFPVLSQTFVLELAAGLKAAGLPLHVLATGSEGADPAILEGHPAGAGLAACMIPPRASAGEIGGFLGRRLIAGRPPLRLLARAVARPHRAGALLGRAAAFARCPEVDILHCQFATLGIPALRSRDMGLLRFRRLVVHLRGWDVTLHIDRHGPDALRRVFAEGDLFIAVCRSLAERAVALGCDPARVVVIGSPIDTGRFRPPADRAPPSGVLRIGAVGRLVEKKGFDDLVEAMARVRGRGVEARLEIIGEGPMRPRLERLIAEHGLAESVILRGAEPSERVLAMLHGLDLFAAPSVRAASGDEEGVVNSLKEAMATGLPVIGTRHGGIPELVEDGANGLLVPERAPEALAEAILRLARTPAETRAEMGRAGRDKVVAEFSRPGIAARTVEAYAQALRRPPARK